MEKINKKDKKLILVNRENFKTSITNILRNSNTNYLILLQFKNNLEENLSMLEELKRYFLSKKRYEYLKNTVVFSEREYLANDLGVRGVLTIKSLVSFDIEKLNTLYENFDFKEKTTDDFLQSNSIPFGYKLDLYNCIDPWIMSINGVGILTISDKNYDKIMCNYHKVKRLYPDVTIVVLKGKDDLRPLSLLKMIGADAHITLGITSIKNIPYNKRLDALVYNRSPYSERNIRNFVTEILKDKKSENSLFDFRDFMGIAPKNFEADIFYDEEEEISKKEEKFFKLKVTTLGKNEKYKNQIKEESITLYKCEENCKSEMFFFEKTDEI